MNFYYYVFLVLFSSSSAFAQFERVNQQPQAGLQCSFRESSKKFELRFEGETYLYRSESPVVREAEVKKCSHIKIGSRQFLVLEFVTGPEAGTQVADNRMSIYDILLVQGDELISVDSEIVDEFSRRPSYQLGVVWGVDKTDGTPMIRTERQNLDGSPVENVQVFLKLRAIEGGSLYFVIQ